MKNLLNVFVISLAIILNACATSTANSLDLSTKENIQKCIEKAKEKFNKPDEFHELIFYADMNNACALEMISVEIIDTVKTYLLFTDAVTKADPILIGDEEILLTSFDAIDCGFIIEKFNEAKAKIANKTDEFENFQLKRLGIKVNSIKQLEYSLELLAYQKEVKPTIYGNRVFTKDPRFTFDVTLNENGDITIDTIDE